jgi:hypothetical protein
MHVDWGLDSPSGTIPMAVTQLTVNVYVGSATDPQSSINTVAALTDMDGNGHPDLVRGDLPTGMPIRMTILGQNASMATIYVGHAGPFTLVAGERRYVDLRMYPVGGYGTLSPSATDLPPRLLATTTTLSDGRVLVSGGFTHAMPITGAMCPAGAALCLDLTAAADAYIYEVSSGTFFPVHGGLHQARGGHTATVLPGDRVLVAGGAAHALLTLSVIGSCTPTPTAPCTYTASLQSLDTTAPASTSFEVFLPDANAASTDPNRDGNPGRGGFVGAAEDMTGMTLGRLDAPRFMHAAAVVPGHPTQVLLAGGLDSGGSWVVYDDARAGGYGVLDSTMNHLQVSRPMPAVVPLHSASGDSLWIVGGGTAASNADLAEVWTQTAMNANGTTVPATMYGHTPMFPSATAGDHPELNLTHATAISIDASHALFVGWYGPRCNPADSTHTTPYPAFAGTSLCDPAAGSASMNWSFTIDGMTGIATGTGTHNRHAFGAGVHMSDGSTLVAGGIGSLGFTPNNTTDAFDAMILTGSAHNNALQPLLATGRMLHSMAALDDGGALVLGGLALTTSSTPITATLLASPEVMYLPRP